MPMLPHCEFSCDFISTEVNPLADGDDDVADDAILVANLSNFIYKMNANTHAIGKTLGAIEMNNLCKTCLTRSGLDCVTEIIQLAI